MFRRSLYGSMLLTATLGVVASHISAQAPPAAPPGGQLPGRGAGPGGGPGRGGPGRGGFRFGPPSSAEVFEANCASCHTAEGKDLGGRVAASLTLLRALPPERIYQSMASGSMAVHATSLVDKGKRDLASYVAGRPFNDVEGIGIAKMMNQCSTNPRLGSLSDSPSWTGWSPTTNNARFQPAGSARLTAADAPKLKLKWAFGIPGGGIMSGQPTVAFNRVFVASDNNVVYAMDAKTGCAYWAFHAESSGRFAPVVAPISGHPGASHAVFFATNPGTTYAVNVQDGKLLWKTEVRGLHNVSASSAFHDGRLYIPLAGTETMAPMMNPNAECCRSRGGLAALDANTGKILWKVDTIPEAAKQVGTNPGGRPIWGLSGASVWNTPTVDPKRRRVYVGTGNSYGPVAADTSDSIIAFNMEDGTMVWHHQEFKGDSFMVGCGPKSPAGGLCPETLGPDWDFGGASAILQTLPNGRDVLVAAGKGGVAIALDPESGGKLVWRTPLFDGPPPSALGLVLWGGTADGTRVYYPLQQPNGGLVALQLESGKIDWKADIKADNRGQSGAASSIPGVVFTGGWDGILRAVDASGHVIWAFNTAQDFKTVNGISAKGGSLGVAGAAIANGMVYVPSGYVGVQSGTTGNVLLAFGVD